MKKRKHIHNFFVTKERYKYTGYHKRLRPPLGYFFICDDEFRILQLKILSPILNLDTKNR